MNFRPKIFHHFSALLRPEFCSQQVETFRQSVSHQKLQFEPKKPSVALLEAEKMMLLCQDFRVGSREWPLLGPQSSDRSLLYGVGKLKDRATIVILCVFGLRGTQFEQS